MTMTGNVAVPIAVPIDDARAFLRLDAGGDEAALNRVLRSASTACETAIGQMLVQRTIQEVVDVTRDWQRLDAAPVQAITAVDGLPADGAAFALPVQNYAVDIDRFGNGWVRVITAGAAGQVRVTALAGIAPDAATVPGVLQQGILVFAGQCLRARDGDSAASSLSQPDDAVTALWRGWRWVRL